MNKTLSTYEAADYLMQDENANWSYPGAFALVEYLEEMEEGCDTAIEFDAVAIRCDYSEYSSLIEWADDYLIDRKDTPFDCDVEYTDEEACHIIRDYITDRGTLIEFDGGIIVSSF